MKKSNLTSVLVTAFSFVAFESAQAVDVVTQQGEESVQEVIPELLPCNSCGSSLEEGAEKNPSYLGGASQKIVNPN